MKTSTRYGVAIIAAITIMAITFGIGVTIGSHSVSADENSADEHLSAQWLPAIAEARISTGLAPVTVSAEAESLVRDDILGLATTPLTREQSQGTNWRVVSSPDELLGLDITYDAKYDNGSIAVGQQMDGTYIVVFLEEH